MVGITLDLAQDPLASNADAEFAATTRPGWSWAYVEGSRSLLFSD